MRFRCGRCGVIDASDARTSYRDARCTTCQGPLTAADPMDDIGFECPRCHATVPANATRCPSCNAGGTQGSRARFECPVCTIPLTDRAIDVAVVSGCDRCSGVFLHHDVLERWTADRAARAPDELVANGPAPVELAVRYRTCPLCGEMMSRTNFAHRSGIIVDVCKRDGVWFDGGELEAAIDFARTGHYDAARLQVQRERAGRPGPALEPARDAATRADGLGRWAIKLARFLLVR